MPRYSIKEIYREALNPSVGDRDTLLFGNYYNPPTEEETDTRPEYVKPYVKIWGDTSGTIDSIISRDFGDYVMIEECDDVHRALDVFRMSNIVYLLTHDTELRMVYKAFTSDFNPVENYDRYEKTDVHTDSSGGAKTQTSPDDSENFYNVGNAESEAESDVGTTSRIHGNIGVTEAVTMIDHTVSYFGENSMYDYLIRKLIGESCILVDYGNNAL